jgi:ferredoxin-nitrite reductase
MEETSSVSSEFTPAQKEYLQGFVAGVAARRLGKPFAGVTANGLITNDPGEAIDPAVARTHFGFPVEDLAKEEQFKLDENPLDIWDKLVAHAEANKAPEGGDIFRFKFHGLFYVAPAQDSFMVRVRVPGCTIKAAQLLGLADIAVQWGGGYGDITTRGNIQLREFQPKNIVNVLTTLSDLGLTSRGAGADNVRNITATPTSGLDRDELYDVIPLAKALQFYLLNHRELYGIPRKFNVAFDSGGLVSNVSDTNDIGFVATKVLPGKGVVDRGVYYRVLLAGITGHQQFGQDAGILCKPEECVAIAAAMIRVFNENGDRTNRKKARLKYLIEKWGIDRFVDETESKLTFPLQRFAATDCVPRKRVLRHGHIGVYKQKQRGLNYVGAVIPVGRLTHQQMRRLARIADLYCGGELRFTVWQNAILPNIRDSDLETVKRDLIRCGLHYSATSISGGLVACTGNTGCRFSATNTKGQALELARHLEGSVNLDFPINIHLTGCPNSCAQHYIADIGLLGVKVGSDSREGYNIYVGGGADDQQGLGREVFRGILFEEVKPIIRRMLVVYQREKRLGETFQDFVRKYDLNTLQQLFAEEPR